MGKQGCVAWLVALIVVLITAAVSVAGEQPRNGGVLTWLEYADLGRLDIHSESPCR